MTRLSQDPQKLSQRRRDSKSQNNGGGTQRSRDPNKTKAVPEKLAQESKSTQGVWRDREKPGHLENKSGPREARTENQRHTRGEERPREAGSQTEQ